mgnify:FL=1
MVYTLKKIKDINNDEYSRKPANEINPLHPGFRTIDLFSGAGGLSLGFSPQFGQNFKPVWANGFNESAVATFNKNFDDVCQYGDILQILNDAPDTIPNADVVMGGPPAKGLAF